MKDVGIILSLGLIIISCTAIGAYLVMQGHPGYGLCAMIIGASVLYKKEGQQR